MTSGCRPEGSVDGPDLDLTASSQTRPTPIPQLAEPYDAGEFVWSFPRRATRSCTERPRAAAAADRHISTPSCTVTGTSSSERSTDSRAGEASPPATTNTPATTEPASSSPASCCSGRRQRPIDQTGPSTQAQTISLQG